MCLKDKFFLSLTHCDSMPVLLFWRWMLGIPSYWWIPMWRKYKVNWVGLGSIGDGINPGMSLKQSWSHCIIAGHWTNDHTLSSETWRGKPRTQGHSKCRDGSSHIYPVGTGQVSFILFEKCLPFALSQNIWVARIKCESVRCFCKKLLFREFLFLHVLQISKPAPNFTKSRSAVYALSLWSFWHA